VPASQFANIPAVDNTGTADPDKRRIAKPSTDFQQRLPDPIDFVLAINSNVIAFGGDQVDIAPIQEQNPSLGFDDQHFFFNHNFLLFPGNQNTAALQKRNTSTPIPIRLTWKHDTKKIEKPHQTSKQRNSHFVK